MPDIFVPADTTKYTTLHRQLIRNHIITKISIVYAEKNRALLSKQFSTFEAFKLKFDTQEVLSHIKQETLAKEIAFTKEEWNETKDLLAIQAKAIIARNLWSTNEYFEIINETNDFVKKAIEVLKSESIYYNTLQ